MRKPSFLLAALLAIAAVKAVAAGQEPLKEVQYTVSADRTELVLAFVEQKKSYYFNNDAKRVCYTYPAPGMWRLSGKPGTLLSKNRRASISVALRAADDLQPYEGVDMTARALSFLGEIYAKISDNQHSMTVTPFPTKRAGAVKYAVSWSGQTQGKPTVFRGGGYLAEFAPGWVAHLELGGAADADGLASSILSAISTTTEPECYWPFIRHHVPGAK